MSIDLPHSETPRVSVIIVAASNSDLLRACLRSVARFGPSAIPFETIVVLNEADQDAEAELRATVTGVKVVSSPVNLGLAGGGNLGRSLARGENLLLLHDDAEVEAGWMEALLHTVDAHPEAGAVGGKVLHPDGRLQNAGMILWRDAYTSPPWIGEAPPPTALDRLRAVDYCGTSSLLVRAVAWDAAGGLDERLYPVYYVDVDLSMALRRLGFVVLYQPASRIRHHQGASGNFRFRKFASERNRQIFIEKWAKALEGHDQPARQSPSAVERAMARAEAFGEERRRRGPPGTAELTARAAFDPIVRVSQHYERNRVFQNAFIKHLTGALERAEEELKRVEEDLKRTEEEHKKLYSYQTELAQQQAVETARQEAERMRHFDERAKHDARQLLVVRAALSATREKLKRRRRKLAAIRSTFSWRITRPFRWLRRRVAGLGLRARDSSQ